MINPRMHEMDESSPGVDLLRKISRAADLAAEQCRDGAAGDPEAILATVFASYRQASQGQARGRRAGEEPAV